MSVTATEVMREQDLKLNLRRMRAEMFVSAVLNELRPFLREEDGPCDRPERDAYYALLKLFIDQGVDVITDYTRQEAGLPPRDGEGWTRDELVALEAARLALIMRPMGFYPKLEAEANPR